MPSLRILQQHKTAVVAVALVALLLAIMTSYSPTFSPPGLASRAIPHGAATAQILVDSPQSALANLKQSTVPLTTRAGVFAQFMASNAVRDAVAEATGIPSGQIIAQGPFDDPATAPTGTAAPDPAAAGTVSKPFRLTFVAQDDLPLVTVYAEAPDARRAKLLADGVVRGVKTYVDRLQSEGQLPLEQRVVIRSLGPADSGTVTAGASVPVMLFAFLALTGLGCFGILAVTGIARGRREREAAELMMAITEGSEFDEAGQDDDDDEDDMSRRRHSESHNGHNRSDVVRAAG
jgi:hypothetical protein